MEYHVVVVVVAANAWLSWSTPVLTDTAADTWYKSFGRWTQGKYKLIFFFFVSMTLLLKFFFFFISKTLDRPHPYGDYMFFGHSDRNQSSRNFELDPI